MDENKSAAYLKEKRIASGLSVNELAEKVGAGAYDVSCWEAGFFPEAKYLLPLSQALGASVEEILKGEDQLSEAPPAPQGSCESVGPSSPVPQAFSHPEAPISPSAEHSKPETLSAKPRSTPSPPRRKEEKSYYESLHEKIEDTDVVETYPSGQNGFSAWERKFGYILCSAFIAILLLIHLSGLIGYINRDREVTIENYTKYVEVSVENVSNFDPQEYGVSIIAKERITDFEITVEVCFRDPFAGTPGRETENLYKTVSFSAASITKGTRLTQRISFDRTMIDEETTVISISGGLD